MLVTKTTSRLFKVIKPEIILKINLKNLKFC